jgi:hypothetical protein
VNTRQHQLCGSPRAHDDASARARRRQGLKEQEHVIRRPEGLASAWASRGARRGRRPGDHTRRTAFARPTVHPLTTYRPSDATRAVEIGSVAGGVFLVRGARQLAGGRGASVAWEKQRLARFGGDGGKRRGASAAIHVRGIGSNQEPVRNAACRRGFCEQGVAPRTRRPRRTLVAARSVRSSSSGLELGTRRA